jgi:hypothetical protein
LKAFAIIAQEGQPAFQSGPNMTRIASKFWSWLAALDDFRNWLIREAA